ncbi:MAG: macro domain-containing protein [Planctomycetes bacterium]|nr:macro domain-containing protein [Planctomycetota bacterium]
MLEYVQGDLLAATAEALVNPVNIVGVMGKGLALQFKKAYPDVFKAYQLACKAGELHVGRVFVCELPRRAVGPRWVVHFPTKVHWRDPSRLADIEFGLVDLVAAICRLEMRSIAIPQLGCGNGGLNWPDVQPLVEGAFRNLSGVRVLVFAPMPS